MNNNKQSLQERDENMLKISFISWKLCTKIYISAPWMSH